MSDFQWLYFDVLMLAMFIALMFCKPRTPKVNLYKKTVVDCAPEHLSKDDES